MKKKLCILMVTVLSLTGILGIMIHNGIRGGGISEATAFKRDGLLNIDEQFMYWVDSDKIKIGNGYDGLGYYKEYTGNLSIKEIIEDGVKCYYIVYNHTIVGPDYTGDLSGITADINLGSHQLGADNGGYLRGQTVKSYAANIAGTYTVYFPDAVVKYDGTRYGLYVKVSNIQIALQDGSRYTKDTLLAKGTYDSFDFFAGRSSSEQSFVGVQQEVNCWVDFGDEEDPDESNILMTIKDIDCPSLWEGRGSYYYSGGEPVDDYAEGFRLGDGCVDIVHLSEDTEVRWTDSGHSKDGNTWVYSMELDYTNCAPENSATFLGSSSGFTFYWQGYNCGTTFGCTESDSLFTYVNAETKIHFQGPDGSYDSTTQTPSDSKMTLLQNMYYSYTWTKDYSSSSLYYNKNFTTGGVVKEDTVFHIYVPRRTWSYYFNFTTYCPSGHTSSEITNRQSEIAKLAANYSTDADEIKVPSLSGYTFLGFFEEVDEDGVGVPGTEYTSTMMLSNKTFYATWKSAKYTVRYYGNGTTDFEHQNGEYTQHTVKGTMADSDFEYGVKGNLRKNVFTRCGYIFTGWNTKADGSGTSYEDENEVYNWTTVPDDIIYLYAQWEKVLGKETITVISEETGEPVKGCTFWLAKKVDDEWTFITSNKTTGSDGTIILEDLHWFDYKWVMISPPAGYIRSDDITFTIKPCGTCTKSECDSLTVENTVILYMEHVTITCDPVVDCIIDGENAPAFLYHVSGTDAAGVSHSYNVLAQTSKSTKTGSGTVVDAFAGKYTITQIPVSRYSPQTAVNISHATINGTSATVDVLSYTSAEVQFPYKLTNHGWWYGVDSIVNSLVK